MSLRTLFIPLLLPVCLLSAACHSGAGGGPDNEPQTPPTYLSVQNEGFVDFDIYVLPETGGRIRLGTSTGNTTQSMRIPDYLLSTPITLRFLCSPIGGVRSPVSQAISVEPGETIELDIPPGG